MTVSRHRRILLAGFLVVVLGVGGSVLLAGSRPLRAAGPGEVSGEVASAAFTIGRATVRQVRYRDRTEFRYTFRVRNTGPVPLWLDRPAPGGHTLLRVRGVSPAAAVGPYGTRRLTVRLLMTDCERLSARAASVLSTLRLRVRILGLVPRTVTVDLPERLRVGSAREVSCPRATSTSRPPG